MITLLVVGKGPCWAEDVERFKAFGVPHDVLGVNHAALWLDPAPRYAYSYHPDIMDAVKAARPEVETISVWPSGGVDRRYRMRGETGGSSSYLSARVALEYLGYPRVVLAGVPLSGEYFITYAQQWINGRERLIGRCKSMSGATKALLGEPTLEWLGGEIGV